MSKLRMDSGEYPVAQDVRLAIVSAGAVPLLVAVLGEESNAAKAEAARALEMIADRVALSGWHSLLSHLQFAKLCAFVGVGHGPMMSQQFTASRSRMFGVAILRIDCLRGLLLLQSTKGNAHTAQVAT
eukprot:277698-Amphidinium_carterae.1